MSSTVSLRPAPHWLSATFLAAVAAVACAPTAVAGQSDCAFDEGSTSFQSVTIPGQGQIFYLGSPNFRCADGVRIRADSAVAYQSQHLVLFLGAVRFRDPERLLTSDQARYFTESGRLQAEGHLILRDTLRGSVIENGEMVYLRKTAQREQEQITVVTGVDHVRPKATLYMGSGADSVAPAPEATPMPEDSTAPVADSIAPVALAEDTAALAVPDSAVVVGTPLPARPVTPRDTAQVPYQVEADNLFLQGDQYFLATGTVYIVRDSIYARADSAEYDEVAGRMLLHGSAHVESSSYDLQGRDIDIGMVNGEMRTVRAVREAELVGEDLRLNAPVILLFLTDGTPERLVAVPVRTNPETLEEPDAVDRVRPVAHAESFRLTADSLEVLAPGDVLERIYATGRARGDSSARDSLNVDALPPVARTDWLEGDTVIAYFVPAPPADPDLPPDTTREEYELERLVALGDAKTLYRLLPSDSTSRAGVDAPAVHYVTGAGITIRMLGGEVELMEVDGPTVGYHLEPESHVATGDSVPPDSSVVPPDTTGVPPDTAVVPPDTTSVAGVGPGRGSTEQTEGRPRHDARARVEDAALPAAAFRGRRRERRSGR